MPSRMGPGKTDVLPPKVVRRVVLAPAIPLLTLLLITSLPVVAIVAAFVSNWLPGRWRALRLLWFLLVFAVVESLAAIALFGLWLASGFGRRLEDERWQATHYTLMRLYLAAIVRAAERAFNLEFDVDAEEARAVAFDVEAALPTPDRHTDASPVVPGSHQPPTSGATDADRRAPLLVFSRHAGPGDSFLLVYALLQLRFRPRIVLRDILQWAPVLDTALNRVPSFFVSGGAPPGTGRAAIAELAAGMSPGDALVLFPEGRNFTPQRRRHSITRLEELGDHDAAERAREMRHVLTPRPGGALAAMEMAPDAEVVFVAHTGLEDLTSAVDIWRGVPMDSSIRVKLWRVPAPEVPTHPVESAGWLLGWWRRIDRWILDHYGRDAIPDAVIEKVEQDAPDPPP